jgi:hypothetical protein
MVVEYIPFILFNTDYYYELQVTGISKSKS